MSSVAPASIESAARALLGALREGIVVKDLDGRVVDVSDRMCALTGFDRDELIGASAPYPYWPEEHYATLATTLAEAIASDTCTVEVVFCRKDGTRFPARLDMAPMPDSDERPGILCVVRDITDQVRERELLAASEAALREAQHVAGLGSWDWDPPTDRLAVQGSIERLSFLSPQHRTTLTDAVLHVAPPQSQELHAGIQRVAATGEPFATRVRVTDPDDPIWLEVRASARRDAAGTIIGVTGTTQDVTEQMHLLEDARLRAKLLDEVDAGVIVTDMLGRVTHWNAGAEKLHGHSAADVIGRPSSEVVLAGADDACVVAEIIDIVKRTGSWEGQLQARRADGARFPIYVRNATLEDDAGEPTGVIGVVVDISARVEAERRHASARDYLHAVTASMGEGLCTVDKGGRITYVNPAAERMLGWTSDELVGQQLHETTHFRHADGSVYPAGDCQMVRARQDGETIRVDDDMFIRKDGSELPVSWTSAPIEMEDGVGGAVIVFRDATERRREQARMERDAQALAWLARIRAALRDERFRLHAQPIIDVATGETVQHELLIRMLDDEGGIVPPGAFLPVAEEYGLIREIDRWVIRRAARLAGQGHAVELNLSAESLVSPELYDVVAHELRDAGADPRLIVIELTETALLRNVDVAGAFMERVAELGCRIALDDFGTGYGGFTYVKRLPVDYLKIDIEFVRDLPRNDASQHVVRAIVQLARDFGQKTVAEGVEDGETLTILRAFGVDYAQGYGIARPAPLDLIFPEIPPTART